MTPELSNVLAELAKKLGTSAEHLWPILVARARFDAAMAIVFCVLIVAVLTAFILKAIKAMKEEDDRLDWPTGSLISGALIVIFVACAFGATVNFVYPEVAALKTILGK